MKSLKLVIVSAVVVAIMDIAILMIAKIVEIISPELYEETLKDSLSIITIVTIAAFVITLLLSFVLRNHGKKK
jgi:ABC-type sulfate transport system permease component